MLPDESCRPLDLIRIKHTQCTSLRESIQIQQLLPWGWGLLVSSAIRLGTSWVWPYPVFCPLVPSSQCCGKSSPSVIPWGSRPPVPRNHLGCPRLPRAAPPCPPGNMRPRDCIMHTFRLQVPHGQGLCYLSWLHLFH